MDASAMVMQQQGIGAPLSNLAGVQVASHHLMNTDGQLQGSIMHQSMDQLNTSDPNPMMYINIGDQQIGVPLSAVQGGKTIIQFGDQQFTIVPVVVDGVVQGYQALPEPQQGGYGGDGQHGMMQSQSNFDHGHQQHAAHRMMDASQQGMSRQGWDHSPQQQQQQVVIHQGNLPDPQQQAQQILIAANAQGPQGGHMSDLNSLLAQVASAQPQQQDMYGNNVYSLPSQPATLPANTITQQENNNWQEYERRYGPVPRCERGVCSQQLMNPCKDHKCVCCKVNRQVQAFSRQGWCGPCGKREVVAGLKFVRCGRCRAEMLEETYKAHLKQNVMITDDFGNKVSGRCKDYKCEIVGTDKGRRCGKCTNMRPITFYASEDTNCSCNMHVSTRTAERTLMPSTTMLMSSTTPATFGVSGGVSSNMLTSSNIGGPAAMTGGQQFQGDVNQLFNQQVLQQGVVGMSMDGNAQVTDQQGVAQQQQQALGMSMEVLPGVSQQDTPGMSATKALQDKLRNLMGMVTTVYQTIQSSLNKMDATLSQLHSTQRDQALQMQQGVTNQLAAQLAIFNNLDNVSQLDAQKGEVMPASRALLQLTQAYASVEASLAEVVHKVMGSTPMPMFEMWKTFKHSQGVRVDLQYPNNLLSGLPANNQPSSRPAAQQTATTQPNARRGNNSADKTQPKLPPLSHSALHTSSGGGGGGVSSGGPGAAGTNSPDPSVAVIDGQTLAIGVDAFAWIPPTSSHQVQAWEVLGLPIINPTTHVTSIVLPSHSSIPQPTADVTQGSSVQQQQQVQQLTDTRPSPFTGTGSFQRGQQAGGNYTEAAQMAGGVAGDMSQVVTHMTGGDAAHAAGVTSSSRKRTASMSGGGFGSEQDKNKAMRPNVASDLQQHTMQAGAQSLQGGIVHRLGGLESQPNVSSELGLTSSSRDIKPQTVQGQPNTINRTANVVGAQRAGRGGHLGDGLQGGANERYGMGHAGDVGAGNAVMRSDEPVPYVSSDEINNIQSHA